MSTQARGPAVQTGPGVGETQPPYPAQNLFGADPSTREVVVDPLADYSPGVVDPGTPSRESEDRAAPVSETPGKTTAQQDTVAGWVLGHYVHSSLGISRVVLNDEGDEKRIPLSNWTARIVADVARDDGGSERARTFQIEVTQGSRTGLVEVPQDQFKRVDEWAFKAIGVSAQIAVQLNASKHLGLAVQQASANAERRTVFVHTGWRQVAGQWWYLHGGGAIGAAGTAAGFEVDLPSSLEPLSLPDAARGDQERSAVTASLGLLDLASDPVMACVLGAVWRAPLGPSQLAVWITGPTGAGKTELTALAQRHFGAGFDAQHLPAAWSGTANSINELAYLAKDALMTIDDFVPKGPASTVAKLHATAEQVIRAHGNGAGRSRLDSDSKLRHSRPPRCTLLASGEDIPQGQSLRARLLVMDLAPGELDFNKLTSAQAEAASGIFATAMAGYLRWLAGQPARLGSAPSDASLLRAELIGIGSHQRTASLLAEAALGWRTLLDYAGHCGALTDVAADATWGRVLTALKTCGAQQSSHDADADPAARFTELIAAALSSGRAHLAAVGGNAPPKAWRWGWRDDGTGVNPPWREQGPRVGWVDNDDVYLLPDVAMEIVRHGSGEPIALSKSAMAKRLYERRLLLADELKTRGTYTVRKKVQDRRANTWHLRAADFGAGSA